MNKHPSDEILCNPADPRVLALFLGTIKLFLHPSVVFEEGAEESIREHREQGGNFLLLMTHFRRIGPGHLGSATKRHDVLRPFPGTTGITARRELGKLPVLGYFISRAGVEWIDRSSEHPGETVEEKAERQARNRDAISIGAQYLAAGHNWIMWPEGTTRVKITKPDGKDRKVARDPGVLLPVRSGAGELLNLLTPEQRRNLRLLGVAEYFGPRLLRSLRPTLAITKPEAPVEGTRQDWVNQTQAILQRGVDIAMQHDYSRRRR